MLRNTENLNKITECLLNIINYLLDLNSEFKKDIKIQDHFIYIIDNILIKNDNVFNEYNEFIFDYIFTNLDIERFNIFIQKFYIDENLDKFIRVLEIINKFLSHNQDKIPKYADIKSFFSDTIKRLTQKQKQEEQLKLAKKKLEATKTYNIVQVPEAEPRPKSTTIERPQITTLLKALSVSNPNLPVSAKDTSLLQVPSGSSSLEESNSPKSPKKSLLSRFLDSRSPSPSGRKKYSPGDFRVTGDDDNDSLSIASHSPTPDSSTPDSGRSSIIEDIKREQLKLQEKLNSSLLQVPIQESSRGTSPRRTSP